MYDTYHIMIDPKNFSHVCELIGDILFKPPKYPYRWARVYKSNKEKLIPSPMTKDDAIWFTRSGDHKGKICIFSITPKELTDVEYEKPVVLKSENKATTAIEIDALKSDTSEKYEWTKTFAVGQSESDSLMIGASQSIKNTFGTGDGSPVKGETEIETTLSTEWTKQTGKTKETTTGGRYEGEATAGTKKEAFLTWDEQDLKRHVSGKGTFDFGFVIGKRFKSSGKWWWRGSMKWHTFGEFIDTVSGFGSTKNPLREFFYQNPISAKKIQELKDAWPSSEYSQWYEYKGADGIKVVAKTIPKSED